MIIRVLDSNFRIIRLLKKYTFCQYTRMFRGLGEFTINARLVEENMYLLSPNKDFYVLFDNKVIGKIECIEKESDSEYERVISLKGRLMQFIFSKRAIIGTFRYEGLTVDFLKEIITRNLISSSDTKRNIENMKIVFEDEEYLRTICSKMKRSVTGGNVWNEMEKVLIQDNLGFFFIPDVKALPEGDTTSPNISGWTMIISAGKKRTKNNKLGNKQIVFSQSLSNIKRTEYKQKNEEYCNVAIVAGEGEAEERKWYEIDINKDTTIGKREGWNRSELWIDARDIQSETSDGNTIPQQEYETLIQQRANEKAAENNKSELYECTLTDRDKRYTFGKDYDLGDYVTVVDNELGIETNVQITKVTKSIQDNIEIVDVTFQYGTLERDKIKQFEESQNKTEQNENVIKYLEAKITNIVNNMVDKFTSKYYLAMHPVGDIIINTSGVNPGSRYGGTWELFGEGCVIAGYKEGDSNFGKAEKKLGSIVNLNHGHGMVHSHTVNSHNHSTPNHNHLQTWGTDDSNTMYHMGGVGAYGSAVLANAFGSSMKHNPVVQYVRYHFTRGEGGGTTGNSAPNTNNGARSYTDKELTGSNIQPTIVVYMWKRTK